MTDGTPIPEVVETPYSSNIVVKSLLVIVLGAVVTLIVLYFSLNKEVGGLSYEEGYRVIAGMRQEILTKSLAIYVSTSVVIAAGIVIIALLYSHRVAGPLYRLEMAARKIATGDFTEKVRLRSNDAIHPLADDLNAVTDGYRDLVNRLEMQVKELKEGLPSICEPGKSLSGDEFDQAARKLAETTDEIRETLSRVML